MNLHPAPERRRADLATVPLFAGIDAPMLERLAAIGEWIALPEGRMIFSQGRPADTFYVLMQGEVKVFKQLRDGRSATLRHVRRGETFGESVLFADSYPANAVTTMPTTIVRFDVVGFRELMLQTPELALAVMARMAQLMVVLSRRVEELLLPVPARLARYLLELCDDQVGSTQAAVSGATGGPGTTMTSVCTLPISKRELAARLGTVPETLSRAFGGLRRARVVRLGGTSLVEIVDREALARVAQY